MFDRSERRHHIERLKETRKNYWGYGRVCGRQQEKMNERQLGAVVQHPKSCSCSMCGNPRRHSWFKAEKLTISERSFNEVFQKVELAELV